LREGVVEKAIYGTIGAKEITYKIYEQELSTYHVQKETIDKPSHPKLLAPLRLFNYG